MATYAQLFELRSNSPVRNRVTVACAVAAEAIRGEPVETDNNANRLIWAAKVMPNPLAYADEMLWSLLAANKDQDVATITAASDATVQSQVDDAVNLFATGG